MYLPPLSPRLQNCHSLRAMTVSATIEKPSRMTTTGPPAVIRDWMDAMEVFLGYLFACKSANTNNNEYQIQTIFVFLDVLLRTQGWGPGGGQRVARLGLEGGCRRTRWDAAERGLGVGLGVGSVRTGLAARPVIAGGRSAGGAVQQVLAVHRGDHAGVVAGVGAGGAEIEPHPGEG